jgi:hypothetical protein
VDSSLELEREVLFQRRPIEPVIGRELACERGKHAAPLHARHEFGSANRLDIPMIYLPAAK